MVGALVVGALFWCVMLADGSWWLVVDALFWCVIMLPDGSWWVQWSALL